MLLDVLLHGFKPYHLLAFDYADDHQRVRLVLEALAALQPSIGAPDAVISMFDTCISGCPHPSLVAQAALRLSALRHNILTSEEVVGWFAENEFTSNEKELITQHFYPDQLLGYPSPNDGSPIVRRWMAESPAKISAASPRDLALTAWSYRTDYQKFRAGEQLVSQAVRAGDKECLELVLNLASGHLSAQRRKPVYPAMQKRHRKAGLMSAAAIGFVALGDRKRASEIRDWTLAQFIERDGSGPGETLVDRLCSDATYPAEVLEFILAWMHPGPPERRDADVEAMLVRMLRRHARKLEPRARRRVRQRLCVLGLTPFRRPAQTSPRMFSRPSWKTPIAQRSVLNDEETRFGFAVAVIRSGLASTAYIERLKKIRQTKTTDETAALGALSDEVNRAIGQTIPMILGWTTRAGRARDPDGFEAHTRRALRVCLGPSLPKEHFAGTPLSELPGHARSECLQEAAKLLAQLHACRKSLPPWFNWNADGLRLRCPPLRERELTRALRLAGKLSLSECRLQAHILLKNYERLPTGDGPSAVVVHGDLHPGNILFSSASQRCVLIDWEDSSLGCREEDLGWLSADLAINERADFFEAYRRYAGDVTLCEQSIADSLQRHEAYNRVWDLTYVYLERETY